MVASPPPPHPTPPEQVGDGVEARSCASPTPSLRRKGSPNRSGGSARKSSSSREFGSSILNSVNKSASQFKKSINRKSGSPIDWFPRKKTEPYLKRKIKRLQESNGMTASLDETLGSANPHYTRMAREKIAAREAARKAMEARKAAMVEASWCRILHAARIQKKDAEEVMEKAKFRATEAFEQARVIGVMMYDRPDCSSQQYEVESLSQTGGQSTHKVTASFQTGFEVDMEVAAAVKKAFIQLANSSISSNKEEFKELLWKISQNPDVTEIDANSEDEQHQGDCNSEDKRNLKFNKETLGTGIFPSDFDNTNVQQSNDLVNIMLERLKALHEDELASLAVIVATSGLNAVLQSDRGKYQETESVNSFTSQRAHSRRYSTAASFVDVLQPKKEVTSELPSLDKFLVKHLSKLEKEVHEAREAGRKASSVNSCAQGAQRQITGRNPKATDSASDLSSILVKHVSKLEKEILEAKKNNNTRIQLLEESCKKVEAHVEKDASKESEFYNAQSESFCNSGSVGSCNSRESYEKSKHGRDCSQDKENKILFSHQLPPSGAKGKQGGKRLTRIEAAKLEALNSFCTKDGNAFDVGLDKILIRPIHRLEREKKKALEHGQTNVQKDPQKNGDRTIVTGSLDEILVKHVSRLEREKIDYERRNALGEGLTNVPHDQRKHGNNATASESLDQVLVKHVSRLEREKIDYEKRNALEEVLTNVAHDQRKHDNNATASESLDQVLVKHVSRLEREKVEYAKRNTLGERTSEQNHQERHSNTNIASDSLDQILVKHVSRLEKEKIEHGKSGDMIFLKKNDSKCTNEEADLSDILVKRSMKLEQAKLASSAAEETLTGSFNPVQERRRAREKELMDAWGGVGLGNSMKPHLSKIEKDKVAWRKAEEEQKQMCAANEL
ncbi:uncharacterized protein LOC127767389 [Oryza glaberrima]|uniref:Uncharacterized protein n=1 Tax=Oryza glaberrima TaxID=4538 RepID=I1PDC1_ORYGL|nr:uncharacterized protein LOC127767389 [Oryza glaberrima]